MRPDDFAAVELVSTAVYPDSPPWTARLLGSITDIFPAGQLVAVDEADGAIVGMAASLIVRWDDYTIDDSWRAMTSGGTFANHDPTGRTLYGAEVMVHPDRQGRGVGKALYRARRNLVRELKLRRIRAGARLRGYHRVADRMTAEDYVHAVVDGELRDPTLTFQLRQHFHVLAVVPDYLKWDPASLGWAAVIEWINHRVAKRKDYAARSHEWEPHH